MEFTPFVGSIDHSPTPGQITDDWREQQRNEKRRKGEYDQRVHVSAPVPLVHDSTVRWRFFLKSSSGRRDGNDERSGGAEQGSHKVHVIPSQPCQSWRW